MKSKKAFTLAEIIGVIVIVGLLILIVVPTITSRINSSKDKSKDVGYKMVYMAVSQHITENKPRYPSGKKYCIKISDLIEEGKLVSPVKEIDTGKNIDDYSVLVYIYSSGNEYYEIPTNDDQCQNETNLPMIDFLVNPAANQWTNGNKTVTILYPEGTTSNQYKKNDLSWAASEGNRPDVIFTENGKLTARAQYKETQIKSTINIEKIDKNTPSSSFSPNTQGTYVKGGKKVIITITDNESGLLSNQTLSYAWTTSTSTPTSGWKTKKMTNTNSTKSTNVTIQTNESSNLNGTYYLHVKSGIKDMVGNQSINSKSSKFLFDNGKPSISFSPNTQETYVKGGKEVTITIKDNRSGLKKAQTVYYKWTNSTATPTEGWSSIKTTNDDGEKSTTVTVPASASDNLEGTYYLHVKSGIIDVVENESNAAKTNKIIFDNKGPTCTNSGDSTSWTKDDRTITWGCSDIGSGCKEGKSGGSKTYTTTTQTDIIEEYTIEDNAGNTTTCPQRTANVYVDKTPPTLSSVSSSPNGWTTDNVTVSLNGSDAHSGVGKWQVASSNNPKLKGKAHVQRIGWGEWTEGETILIGTTGVGLRLEALQLMIDGGSYSGGIKYQAHVQTYGDQEEKTNGQTAGVVGESKRIEAIKISLTGDIANYYNVSYRAHVQSIGWQNFVSNGELAGTTGQAKRIEALEIKLERKQEKESNFSDIENSARNSLSQTFSNQQYTRKYYKICDRAGNCSSSKATDIKIDTTNPQISNIVDSDTNIVALCSDLGGSGTTAPSASSSISRTLSCQDNVGHTISKTQPTSLRIIQGEPSIAVCPCDSNLPSRDECFAYNGNNYNTMYISNMSVTGTTFKFHVHIKSNSMVAGWSHNCSDGTKGKLCFAKGENGTSCYKEIKTNVSLSGFCTLGTDIINQDFSVNMSSYDNGSYRIIFIGASDWDVSSFYKNSAATSGNTTVVRKG